jgi:hypothetical protein
MRSDWSLEVLVPPRNSTIISDIWRTEDQSGWRPRTIAAGQVLSCCIPKFAALQRLVAQMSPAGEQL